MTPKKTIRIGTRESELAVWQANTTKTLLEERGYSAELVYIKSEGDIDLKTPLYAMGVQGVFTRSLDAALLNKRIDIAVHSMKDVPVQLPQGIAQAAVLERASYKDLLVLKSANKEIIAALEQPNAAIPLTIGTSSIRRKAQWLHRYPNHQIENLRGNVNTRLKKVAESNWSGAIFAAAGLERINLRPASAIELNWMLPAPAQGAIMVVCREEDQWILEAADMFNHKATAICTKVEREFLSGLLGGCSTPISALASIDKNQLYFEGNIVLPDGSQKASIEKVVPLDDIDNLGNRLALELIINGGELIANNIRTKEK